MNLIKEKIIDTIADETGINLSAKDLQVTEDNTDIIITLYGSELFSVDNSTGDDPEDEDFAEQIMAELLDEYYDIREKIIELKLAQLNEVSLPAISEKIMKVLRENNINKRTLDVIDFEFVDALGPDLDWGMAKVALKISDFESFDFNFPVDITKSDFNINYDQLAKEVIAHIGTKTKK